MGRWITVSEDRVLRGQDDRVVDREKRAERMVTFCSGFSGELDGLLEETLLNVSRRHERRQ